MECIKGSVVVHSPHFFPWPPLLARLALAETIVFLDHLPFKKDYFQHRTKLIQRNEAIWIGLPILKASTSFKLKDVTLASNTDHVVRKMRSTIEQTYGKTPYFRDFFPAVEQYLDYIRSEKPSLEKCAKRSTDIFFNKFGSSMPKMVFSSSLGDVPKDRNEMVAYCADKVGAITILNGFGGSRYVHDAKWILDSGFAMKFVEAEVYDNFTPGLSYLHYLFLHGPKYFDQLIDLSRSAYER